MRSIILSLVSLVVVDSSQRCTNPQGENGDKVTEGCLQRICKAGVWRTSLANNICCYERTAYTINTTISSSMSEDGCVRAAIDCVEETPGIAKTILSMENFCKNYATKEQVEEIKNIIVNQIEGSGAGCQGDTEGEKDEVGKEEEEGVIVSGGINGQDNIASTEVFLPPTSSGSGSTCSLQSMPSPRDSHTMDQLYDGTVLACGGNPHSSLKTCEKFDGTSWSQYSTQQYNRYYHTSLAGQHGLLLMGGWHSRATTELVGGDQQYNLQQDTYRACGITEPGSDNTIILTGGCCSINTVAIYGYNGFIGALPSLQIARHNHGCGVLFVTGRKVFVVAGGYGSRYLDSTELLYDGGESWVTGQALPRTLGWAASVSLADSVLLLGGRSDLFDYRREILSFNSSLGWTEVGTLQKERSNAAATAVTFPRGHLDLSNCP